MLIMHLFQQIPNRNISGLMNAGIIRGIKSQLVDLKLPSFIQAVEACTDKNDAIFISDTSELNWQITNKLKCKVYTLDTPVPKFAANNPLFKELKLDNVADNHRFPLTTNNQPYFSGRIVTYIHSGLDRQLWEWYLDKNPSIICFGKYIKSYGYIGGCESKEVMGLISGATYMHLDGFLLPELFHYNHKEIIDSTFNVIEKMPTRTFSDVLEEEIIYNYEQ